MVTTNVRGTLKTIETLKGSSLEKKIQFFQSFFDRNEKKAILITKKEKSTNSQYTSPSLQYLIHKMQIEEKDNLLIFTPSIIKLPKGEMKEHVPNIIEYEQPKILEAAKISNSLAIIYMERERKEYWYFSAEKLTIREYLHSYGYTGSIRKLIELNKSPQDLNLI